MKKLLLNNGIMIPCIGSGLGICRISPIRKKNATKISKFIERVVNKIGRKYILLNEYVELTKHAINNGFTLIDHSAAYGNERLIGEAIKRSNASRERVFLTTRVSNKQQYKGNIKEQFFNTLKRYQTDYIDLYMFHWPVTGRYIDTWKQMIELYKQGYCKAIGVANCHQHHIEALLNVSDIKPAINQIEVHPLFTQKPLINYCKSKGIVVEAYTPTARYDDRLVKLPKLKSIAQKYNKSIVQIILRWHIQNDVIPIVRSLNKKHQVENISIFDFELTQEDIKIIDSININSRLRYDPDNCDFSIL